jgi:hypothetical protein
MKSVNVHARLPLGGLAVLLALTLANPLHAATLPDGFHEQLIAVGITGATAMEIAPDGGSSSANRPAPSASSRMIGCCRRRS